VIETRGLRQLTDTGAIESLISDVVSANPHQVQQYREGKQKVFGFFVGRVMQASKGKADPKQVNDLLRDALK